MSFARFTTVTACVFLAMSLAACGGGKREVAGRPVLDRSLLRSSLVVQPQLTTIQTPTYLQPSYSLQQLPAPIAPALPLAAPMQSVDDGDQR
jgi:hypothetical protein